MSKFILKCNCLTISTKNFEHPTLSGRADKIFCSTACKNEYHLKLRRATAEVVRETDNILHRNRSILLELMGKNARQKKVDGIFGSEGDDC